MIRKYVLFVGFLLCYTHGIDSIDISSDATLNLNKYSIVSPQIIHRWARSVHPPPESEQKYTEESISYALTINNQTHHLHLKRNKNFLSQNFVQYSHDNSNSYRTYPKDNVHCYYHGDVEGYEDSLVALSTCSGLRGVIVFDNRSYAIEPVLHSVTNEHRLYQLKDVQSGAFTCGVLSENSTQSHSPFHPDQSLTSLLRRKRNLPETSYVELALVVDNLRYNFKKRNETAVREEMVEMANLLDGYYKQLNIRVVLVGLEVFKDSNPFDVNGSAGKVLERFVAWRKAALLPRVRHDIGQLIVGQPQAYGGGVLGMAFVGSVCSVASSGGINVFSDDSLAYVSTVVAHEMGHNLGMNHDDQRCSCDGKGCIMGASASGSTAFSTCSGNDFEKLILRGGGACLLNKPSFTDVVGIAKCGNGLLEGGEQCDCGTPQECKTKCCDAATCKFTPGSKCAQGSCCNNCQIKVAGTNCRKSLNTCDLPEYCDGKTAFCPSDFYIVDGVPCENNAAYCYEGRCQTYDYQCRYLFAPDPAIKAEDVCFQYANTKGNLFGNCGRTSSGDFIPCSVADAMCGKVQCTNVDVNRPPTGAHVSIQIIQDATCVNADFKLGSDVRDPAYVNPGSPCGKGKTCLDFHCVNASALLADLGCDAETTCNGRGVCNDQGHCHCEDGWAFPNCDRAGWGGSIDSGPSQIDYSLRDGLLIFFLLVVPVMVLLILLLLYIYRRDSLDICLKKKRAGTRNTENGNVNSNGPTAATVQPPVSPPADKPQHLPATSAPISGFRYGELDYWNTDPSMPPASEGPPPPRQGPGVPKPIPPRQLPQ
ncbi:disintegrin and metalloproteinase domain-containing protein 9 [Genypterus blacodes]|uniref:disintegrin and metalloproteinase domain-containing protein 9 n=1 Tax=Genypterus blacodes TaxID=154954 RepID=UPI003F774F64